MRYTLHVKRVFSRPTYLALAVALAITMFLAIAWWRAVPLLFYMMTDADLPLTRALELAQTLLVASLRDSTTQGFAYAAASSLLIGINATLLIFYVRLYRAAPSSATASGLIGGIAAMLGFGCAACGSIFLTSLAASLGGAGLLALLPYGGEEIGSIGLALLAASTALLARAVNKPAVCPI